MLFPIVPPVAALAQAEFTTLIQLAGSRATFSKSGFTLLTKIAGSLITQSGTKVRLVLESGGVACTLNNVTIGPAVTSGSAWNCTSVTAVTFGGAAAWSIAGAAGTEHLSDEITFEIITGTSYIVGVNMGATANASSYRNGLPSGVTGYQKAGVQEADDATRGASYTANASVAWLLKRIDVR